jgi:hypothetical protein
MNKFFSESSIYCSPDANKLPIPIFNDDELINLTQEQLNELITIFQIPNHSISNQLNFMVINTFSTVKIHKDKFQDYKERLKIHFERSIEGISYDIPNDDIDQQIISTVLNTFHNIK